MSARRQKIRWAPKAQPEKIRQLYERDARGIVDDDLIDDVGLALTLLDQLAYGEGSAPEIKASYTEWRRAREQMGRL